MARKLRCASVHNFRYELVRFVPIMRGAREGALFELEAIAVLAPN
jgi:hypothetical protein